MWFAHYLTDVTFFSSSLRHTSGILCSVERHAPRIHRDSETPAAAAKRKEGGGMKNYNPPTLEPNLTGIAPSSCTKRESYYI